MIDRFMFGTGNPEKVARIRSLVRDLPVAVVTPADAGLTIDVAEDGANPLENATEKATTYLAACGLPTLSLDGGLYIDSLPPALQPGIHVRRQAGPRASDDDLLAYYQNLIRENGGESKGRWVVAAVFALPGGVCLSQEFADETTFTCVASPVRKPGAPLSSLQVDLDLGKYRSEITADEHAALDAKFDAELSGFLRSVLRNS